MKKRFSGVFLFLILLVACSVQVEKYVAGSYKGIAEGYHSNLVVEVTTDKYSITDIKILEEDETPIIAEIVYEEIPKAVIKANSVDVDVVAGATATSETLLDAIENGLEKARIQTVSEEKAE